MGNGLEWAFTPPNVGYSPCTRRGRKNPQYHGYAFLSVGHPAHLPLFTPPHNRNRNPKIFKALYSKAKCTRAPPIPPFTSHSTHLHLSLSTTLFTSTFPTTPHAPLISSLHPPHPLSPSSSPIVLKVLIENSSESNRLPFYCIFVYWRRCILSTVYHVTKAASDGTMVRSHLYWNWAPTS